MKTRRYRLRRVVLIQEKQHDQTKLRVVEWQLYTYLDKQGRTHKWCTLMDPTHGHAKAGRPARTYIQQLCEDTGCCPEDLPEAMNDREKWRERVRYIRATSTQSWSWSWWYIYIYIYIYIYMMQVHISEMCVRLNIHVHTYIYGYKKRHTCMHGKSYRFIYLRICSYLIKI